MAVDTFPLVRDQMVLAAAIETTTGTAESLSASNAAFNVYDAEIIDETPLVDRQGEGSSDMIEGVPGAYQGRLRFRTDLVGAGASGIPAWASTFLPACGMVATGSTYSFVTGATNQKTLTAGLYEDGVLRQISGAAGTFTIELIAGQIAFVSFDFMGKVEADTDVALLTPTYPTVIPPRFANASGFAYNSTALRVSTVSINAQNDVQMREDPNEAAGFRSAIIVHRNPIITADPEATLVATRDWLTTFRASTSDDLVITIGSASNNTITITAPKAQIRSRPRGNRHGIIVEQVEFQCNRNASTYDSHFTLAFS